VGLYKKWCEATKEENKRKRYWTYVEKDGGREEVRDDLAETMRSHYDRLERIADDVQRLGYKVAAEILRAQLPQTDRGRSGDLGEILATELVEEEIGLRVPVRRLRYKDGRNMAMRGDDFIGAGYGGDDTKLWLLKGEAKSNKAENLSWLAGPAQARSDSRPGTERTDEEVLPAWLKLFGRQNQLAAQPFRPPVELQIPVRMAPNHALHHAHAETPAL
jgi:hypothetical protein